MVEKILFKLLWQLGTWLLLAALVLVAGVAAFVFFHPTFGSRPDAVSRARITASPYFNGRVFANLEPTEIQPRGSDHAERPSLLGWLHSVTNPPAGKQPAEPLPSVALDLPALKNGCFAWLGHSTVLLRQADATLLFDPVFHRASPVFLGGAPFAMRHTHTAAEMPPLDAVLISHDHYDHLDYRAIRELDGKTRHFYVPPGVKAHLRRWGVADGKITELDWYQSATLGDLHLTLIPTRHFSGRNFTNRNSTLWGAWVVRSPGFSVYFNGDSGFGRHFAANGEQYGPFDLAFMENGAYNDNWAQIHMTPEESVAAARLLGAKRAVPIHWAKFDLAYHPWKEPIVRFLAAADQQGLMVITPLIGEVFDLEKPPQRQWWETVQ